MKPSKNGIKRRMPGNDLIVRGQAIPRGKKLRRNNRFMNDGATVQQIL